MMRLVLDETEKGRARQERARIEDQLGWKEAAAWETRQKSIQNPTWDFDKGELKLYDRATTEFGFTPNEARGLVLNQRQNNFQNSMMRLVLDETEKGRARQERARIEDQLGWKEAAAWDNRQKSIQNPTWDFDKSELRLYDKLTANYRPPQQRTGGRQIMMPRQMQDVRYTIVLPRENIRPTKKVANKAQIREAKQLSAVTSVIVGQNPDDERKSRRISLPGIEVSQEIGKKTLNIADQILNVNTTEQTPRTAAILRQDVVPVNRVNNATITTPIEVAVTRQDIMPVTRVDNINRTIAIPKVPRRPRIPIPPRRRRRTDRTDDPLGGFRRIRVENIEHLSILDPLEALGIGSMTNRSRKKAQPKTTYYEYGGGYHAEPPGADYLGLVIPKQRSKSRKQASKKRGRR